MGESVPWAKGNGAFAGRDLPEEYRECPALWCTPTPCPPRGDCEGPNRHSGGESTASTGPEDGRMQGRRGRGEERDGLGGEKGVRFSDAEPVANSPGESVSLSPPDSRRTKSRKRYETRALRTMEMAVAMVLMRLSAYLMMTAIMMPPAECRLIVNLQRRFG